MPRLLIALILLLPLSCSDQEPPVAQSAFDEQAGPWQTASVNGATYRRASAKANAIAQSADLFISIPVSETDGQVSIPDTIVIAGRIYTVNCLPVTDDSLSVEIPPPVTDDSLSVEIPDQPDDEFDGSDRAILMAFYRATGGGSAWTGNNWGSDEPIGTWEGVTTNAEGRVTRLVLYDLDVSEKIPPVLSQLTQLEWLNLGSNRLTGSIPAELSQLTNLISLSLPANYLSGSIPPELSQLTNLRGLNLGSNRELSGSIPIELGNLANLRTLYLASTQVSGSIPVELGQLTNLERLNLSANQLSGSIPVELGQLTNLQSLSLSGNELTGSIPSALGQLTNLTWIYLSHNQLTGSIPSALGQLAKLEKLGLQHNSLSGSIPSALGQLANLDELELQHNSLSGKIPPELGQLNLERLLLSVNRLSGCIPLSLQGIVINDLDKLGLPFCEPSIEIPPPATDDSSSVEIPDLPDDESDESDESDRAVLLAFYKATGGGSAWTGNNWESDEPIGAWEGVTTNAEGRVIRLSLYERDVSEKIPSALSQLTELEYLNLGGNRLTGSIPSELGN